MAVKKVDKELIIQKACQVFRERGYGNTTMADIGKACGLLKGSIYYYFSSKDELMLQVLIHDYVYTKDNVYSLAYLEQLSCKERLKQILQAMENYYFEAPGGCLMAKIGLESDQIMPEFTKVIKLFFEDWITAFSYIFQSHYDQEHALLLAEQAVQEIEGAIMLSVIFQDKKYYTRTSNKILSYLD
ncbi:TetR family transcriptional regulator [Flammeovirgaceae bacterium 311]|nr:TetR family transcriptional regulator [Flammeovirgaceae bacterium 311]